MGNCQSSHDEPGPTVFQEIMLFNAIIRQNVGEVEARIKYKTNVNCKSSGKTPLNAACVIGNAAIVRLLLEAGANPNDKSDDGMTPLFSVMVNDHIECLELLLKFKVDIPRRVEGLPVATYAATLRRSLNPDENSYLVAKRLKTASLPMTKAETDYFNMITTN